MCKQEMGFCGLVRKCFQLEQKDIRSYSPLTLAYIGDAVYELVVRTVIVENGNKPVNKLHREASQLVKARAQAEMITFLLPQLTEAENEVYRRGRNAKSYTTAKNASVNDYRKATGFEALMGYLYLSDQMERLLELTRAALAQYQPQENPGTEARNGLGK